MQNSIYELDAWVCGNVSKISELSYWRIGPLTIERIQYNIPLHLGNLQYLLYNTLFLFIFGIF